LENLLPGGKIFSKLKIGGKVSVSSWEGKRGRVGGEGTKRGKEGPFPPGIGKRGEVPPFREGMGPSKKGALAALKKIALNLKKEIARHRRGAGYMPNHGTSSAFVGGETRTILLKNLIRGTGKGEKRSFVVFEKGKQSARRDKKRGNPRKEKGGDVWASQRTARPDPYPRRGSTGPKAAMEKSEGKILLPGEGLMTRKGRNGAVCKRPLLKLLSGSKRKGTRPSRGRKGFWSASLGITLDKREKTRRKEQDYFRSRKKTAHGFQGNLPPFDVEKGVYNFLLLKRSTHQREGGKKGGGLYHLPRRKEGGHLLHVGGQFREGRKELLISKIAKWRKTLSSRGKGEKGASSPSPTGGEEDRSFRKKKGGKKNDQRLLNGPGAKARKDFSCGRKEHGVFKDVQLGNGAPFSQGGGSFSESRRNS